MLLSVCAATLSGCTAMPQSSAHQKLCNATLPVERSSDTSAAPATSDILVASHHGRENGCCEELFSRGWKPIVVIISDAGIEHATQETVAWYRARARGMNYNG